MLAWSAFYDDEYSLRSSWCIGRGCKDPAWDNKEEEVYYEVTEQAEQWREQQEQVERSEVADTTEELKTLSLELSSCVAPPFLPSPQQLPMSCHTCHLLETTGRPSQQGCW